MLGIIPDVALSSKAQKQANYSVPQRAGRHVRDMHSCLSAILGSIENAQIRGNGIVVKNFRLGPHVRETVELLIPIACIMGDAKSQDALAGRYGIHVQVQHMCRACNCGYDESGDPTVECTRTVQDTIENLQLRISRKASVQKPDLIELWKYSRHRLPNNALNKVAVQMRLAALQNGEWPEVENELCHVYAEKYKIHRNLLIYENQGPRIAQIRTKVKGHKEARDFVALDEVPTPEQVEAQFSFVDMQVFNLLRERKRLVTSIRDYDQLPLCEAKPVHLRGLVPTKARFDVLVMLVHGPFHLVLLGLVKRCLGVFLGDLTPSAKASLDDSLDVCLRPAWTQRTKDRLPRVNFFRGVTNLTMLTGKEWVGVGFALLVCLLTAQGWKIFTQVFTTRGQRQARNTKTKKKANTKKRATRKDEGDVTDTEEGIDVPQSDDERSSDESDDGSYNPEDPVFSSEEELVKVIYIVEMLLCYEAWITRGPFWIATGNRLSTGEKDYHASITTMLKFLAANLPRRTKVGYRLQKFHEQLHLPFDARLFGHLGNINEGIGEANLQSFVSDPSRTARKLGAGEYLRQICRATYEHEVICRAGKACFLVIKRDKRARRDRETRAVEHENQPKKQIKYVTENGRATLRHKIFDIVIELREDGKTFTSWVINHTIKTQKVAGWLPQHVSDHIAQYYSSLLDRDNRRKITIQGYSEMIQDGYMYRAHPNYRSQAPRYSWSVVKCWEDQSKTVRQKPPSMRPQYSKDGRFDLTAHSRKIGQPGDKITEELVKKRPAPKRGKRVPPLFDNPRLDNARKMSLLKKQNYPILPEKGGHHTIGKLLSFTRVKEVDGHERAFFHGCWRGKAQEKADSTLTETYVLDYAKRDDKEDTPPGEPETNAGSKRKLDENPTPDESSPLHEADGTAYYDCTPCSNIKFPIFVVEDTPGTFQHAPANPEVRAVRERDELWGAFF